MNIEELRHIIEKELPDVNMDRIYRAYKFAEEAHEGQYRMSGEPYVTHPLETAKILANLRVDEDTLVAGLLHDVPEDTRFSVEDIKKRFGSHVAELVSALTKLSKVRYKHSMDDRQIQSIQKMFLETAKDVRVVVIKLADRLHNMTTLHYLRPEKQQRIAKETMEIYAPMANLFGIYQLRRQLEDLSFMHLQPDEYARIEAFVHDHEKKRKHFVNETIEVLKKSLKKAGVVAELEGRPKHFYSIYEKMVRDQKVLQDIYDYFAIRVITENEEQCYLALGKIHEVFKPKPGRIKDYIALPKPNGYQSLHTTVIGLRGKLSEIQIRTREMHEQSEFGAAAHLIYKNPDNPFLKKSIDLLKRFKDPGRFIQTLQEDILKNRIYVFSPEGDVVDLPEGSTCLDYMYVVGLSADKKTFRVMVNNKAYSLIGLLQSGDTIEVIYGNKEREGPERWWLEHVKTTMAKEKIQEHFKDKSFDTKVHLGEQLLQQELDHENQGSIYSLPREKRELVIEQFHAESFDDLLAKIGEGSVNAGDVYRIMYPEIQIGPWGFFRKSVYWILSKLKIRDEEHKYRIRLLVEANDRKGLLKDLIQPFYDLNIPILRLWGQGYDINQSANSTSYALGMKDPNKYLGRDYFDIYIEKHEQLIALIDRLEKVPGVRRVQRVFKRNQLSFVVLSLMIVTYWVLHPFFIFWMTTYHSDSAGAWLNSLIYAGLIGLLMLMMWLKSMGNKTFPHFEETKFFWPMSFGMIFLAIGTLFVEEAVFDLELQLMMMLIFSLLILALIAYSYFNHQKRRRRHLSRLKEGLQKRLTEE